MVSTRLMSSVGGNSSAENPQDTNTESAPAKCTRHNTATASTSHSAVSHDVLKTSKVQTIFLLDLPQEILEKIFSSFSYKEIAHMRPVCHMVDRICGSILNSTFQRLQKQMLTRFQNIKAKMPRRESARRNHPLACESDIIETLHMRLTLLQMTFGKHIERKHCCFFPGEVLDEVYRILHYIKVTTKLGRPYKVTDELFDLSTMAMEYFKEHIEPRLPEIAYFGTDFLDFTGTFSSSSNNKNYLCLDSSPLGAGSGEEVKEDESPSHSANDLPECHYTSEPLPQSNMVLRKRIHRIKQGMKRYSSQLTMLRQDLRACKRKTAEQQKQIAEQQKQLAEQQKQTLEYATRLDENDKKNEETSRKFSTLLQELNKCKTELQYWRSKSPAIPPICKGCGTVFAPVPQEDLQALVNQGVRPEGLGIIPDEPLVTEQIAENAPISDVEIRAELMEEPVLSPQGKSNKRKLTEEPVSAPGSSQEYKKPCRGTKNRVKRSRV